MKLFNFVIFAVTVVKFSFVLISVNYLQDVLQTCSFQSSLPGNTDASSENIRNLCSSGSRIINECASSSSMCTSTVINGTDSDTYGLASYPIQSNQSCCH